ncbi:MAG: NAD-binding protein [Terracidiphilus sp.]
MEKRFDRVVLTAFAVLAVALGAWGYARAGWDYTVDSGIPFNPHHVYAAFQSGKPLLEALRCVISSIGLIRLYDLYQPGRDPWQLVIAQVLVPSIALLSAAQLFLTGVRKNIRTAMVRRKFNHTVVCGLGDVGMQVIENLGSAGQFIAAVDLQDDSPGAATCEKSGVPVLQGDAKNPQVLLAAGIRRAQTAIICTGSDSENMDIALQIKAIYELPGHLKSSRIQVLAQLRNDWMHKRLIGSDKGSMGSNKVDLRLFNPFMNAARMLIKRLHLPPSREFEARAFVVIGFGAYGREITEHLIRACPVAPGRTLNILVLDQKADQAAESFPIANPVAAALASFEFITASVAPGSPDLQRIVARKLESAEPLLGVAVALGNDELSLCSALEIRSLLDCAGHLHVPVYVRLEHYRRLGELVRNIENKSNFSDRLQIFGTLEETLSADVLLGSHLDAFAQALQEEYRLRPRDTINPAADVPWHELPEFMKMSNRWRADHTPLLMELAGLHVARDVQSPVVVALSPEQIELLAELEHRRYTIERRLIEWRQPIQRFSTHLEDWDHLSEEYKEDNRKEVAGLPKIMARLGMEIHPVRKVRLYGEQLKTAGAELEQVLNGPMPAHCAMIVDLDEPEAVSLAARALSLPSVSLWLFSREEPQELFKSKGKSQQDDRYLLIQRANGWSFRDRIALDV